MIPLPFTHEERELLRSLDLYLNDNKQAMLDYKEQQDVVDKLKNNSDNYDIISKLLKHIDAVSYENDILRSQVQALRLDIKNIVMILSDTHRSIDRSMLTTLENQYRYL